MSGAILSIESLYRQIELSQGMYALVDAADYEFLNQWKWRCFKGYSTYYAVRTAYLGGGRKNPVRKKISMHRLILNAPDGMDVDHINGDGLCNIRSNLRIATRQQNSFNQRTAAGKSSQHKGVSRHKRDEIWQAYISINKKRVYLGYFATELDAARAYNEAASKHHGEFARVNIL